MTAQQLLQRYLDECPLIAILRGVTPDEAEAIGEAIVRVDVDRVPLIEIAPERFAGRRVRIPGDSVRIGRPPRQPVRRPALEAAACPSGAPSPRAASCGRPRPARRP